MGPAVLRLGTQSPMFFSQSKSANCHATWTLLLHYKVVALQTVTTFFLDDVISIAYDVIANDVITNIDAQDSYAILNIGA